MSSEDDRDIKRARKMARQRPVGAEALMAALNRSCEGAEDITGCSSVAGYVEIKGRVYEITVQLTDDITDWYFQDAMAALTFSKNKRTCLTCIDELAPVKSPQCQECLTSPTTNRSMWRPKKKAIKTP
jgi:hypothetical protein